MKICGKLCHFRYLFRLTIFCINITKLFMFFIHTIYGHLVSHDVKYVYVSTYISIMKL